jgi:hypothetical protein
MGELESLEDRLAQQIQLPDPPKQLKYMMITSQVLTHAQDNSRNAQRICNHIGDIEFAEYM